MHQKSDEANRGTKEGRIEGKNASKQGREERKQARKEGMKEARIRRREKEDEDEDAEGPSVDGRNPAAVMGNINIPLFNLYTSIPVYLTCPSSQGTG